MSMMSPSRVWKVPDRYRKRAYLRWVTCACLSGFCLGSLGTEQSEARSLAREAAEAAHSKAAGYCPTGVSEVRVTSSTIRGARVDIETVTSSSPPRHYRFTLGTEDAPKYPVGSRQCFDVREQRVQERKSVH